MKCEPGEIAVIVHAHPSMREALGRIVRVLLPVEVGDGTFGPGWRLDKCEVIVIGCTGITQQGVAFEAGEGAWFDEYPDAWLHPLRGLPEGKCAEVSDDIGQPVAQLTTVAP